MSLCGEGTAQCPSQTACCLLTISVGQAGFLSDEGKPQPADQVQRQAAPNTYTHAHTHLMV
jgi:hypothetical protein